MISVRDGGIGLDNIVSFSMSIAFRDSSDIDCSNETMISSGLSSIIVREEIVQSCSSSESEGLSMNVSVLFPYQSVIVLEKTSMIVLAVFRNGLPRMMGTSRSSVISMTTKSVGYENFPTWIMIFSRIRIGCLMDTSAKRIFILIGFIIRSSILEYREFGMALILAPRSSRALIVLE